jgi:hypothetical protein
MLCAELHRALAQRLWNKFRAALYCADIVELGKFWRCLSFFMTIPHKLKHNMDVIICEIDHDAFYLLNYLVDCFL